MALYRVCKSESASAVALSIGRQSRSVCKWVKDYNRAGPKAIHYKRSGGHPPFAGLPSQQ